MVTITIDDREFQAEDGSTILEVARDNGIEIPTLCFNEGLESYGACRLCSVEIIRNDRSRIVASCLYPVQEGLVVKTTSDKVRAIRKMLVELLLARCSEEKIIQDLAKKFGIEQSCFKPEYLERKNCILCAQCVRACQEAVGVSAISLVNRGIKKEVAPPFLETAEACIGCGSCVYICPTSCIKMEDKDDTRIIHNWKVRFKLKKCEVCNNYFAPEAQLEYIRKKAGLPEGFFDKCPNCR